MAIQANDFVISRNIDNEFLITIKKQQTLVAITIDPSDTFVINFINLNTDSIEHTIDMDNQNANGYIEIANAINGQINLVLKKDFISTLSKERGQKEDKYYLKPTYSILIECNTLADGKFHSKIPKVYID